MSRQIFFLRYFCQNCFRRLKIFFATLASLSLFGGCAEPKPEATHKQDNATGRLTDKSRATSNVTTSASNSTGFRIQSTPNGAGRVLVRNQSRVAGSAPIMTSGHGGAAAPAPVPAPAPAPAPVPAPAPAPAPVPAPAPAPAPVPAPAPAPAMHGGGHGGGAAPVPAPAPAPAPVPAPAPAPAPVPAPAPAPAAPTPVSIRGVIPSIAGIKVVNNLVSAVNWDFISSTLVLDVNLLPGDKQLSVWNLQTAELIMTMDVVNITARNVVLKTQPFTSVPCEVAVFATGRFQAVSVVNPGVVCNASTKALAAIEAQLPVAAISSPQTDLQVYVGTNVYFASEFVAGAKYQWNFGGAAPASSLRVPGNILFNRAGTYTVTLNVVNAAGLLDPTPVVRTITVVP